jgi:lysophospholipase L1-like esterase
LKANIAFSGINFGFTQKYYLLFLFRFNLLQFIGQARQIAAYFALIMFLRYFKKLTLGVRAKNSGSNYGSIKFTWRITKTNRTNIKRIMVFGDSNSFRPEASQTSWPKLLENKDPLHLNVLNESCDGRTTRYDIGECNGLRVIGQKLTAHKPMDYVVVMLGTNDVKKKYGPPPVSEIVEGMHLLLDIIDNLGEGAEPILLTPPPLGNVTSGELAGAQLRIPPVVAEYRRLAINRGIRLIDIHSILEIVTDMEFDTIHLNVVGRKKIANALWDNLKEVNPRFHVKGISGERSC